MKVVRDLREIGFDKNTVATVGTFDGVHLAHREIIRRVVELAHAKNGRSVVVTFDPHPREVVGPDPASVRILTTIEERQQECEALGVDLFFIIPFDTSFSKQSPQEFYERYLVRGTGVACVFEGFDHHWGHNREGNIDRLQTLGNEFDFEVVAVNPVSVDGRLVNSSTIRQDLSEGRVEEAARLMGRPYTLRGKVVEGERRGRVLGYPTANLELDSPRKLIPKNGIYLAEVTHRHDAHAGMLSIGVRPTFYDDGRRTIEVNLLDFDENLYEEWLTVSVLRRLRDELKFGTREDLVKQMKKDEQETRRILEDRRRQQTATK